jgi:hypothetical protein
VIVGQTGSGKTVAALYQLSKRSYTEIPWIIFDFKTDEWLNSIPYRQEISLGSDIPREPGIYICHPIPDEDDEDVARMMGRIWTHKNVGVFIDEASMIPRSNRKFTALLAQGRSRRTPCIVATQRPVGISRWAFTEADFFQVYFLLDSEDEKTVQRYLPPIDTNELPKYWSYYYQVADRKLTVLKPVPHPDKILAVFEERLKPMVEMHDEGMDATRGLRIVRKL